MLINIHTHHLSKNETKKIEVYNQYPWDMVKNDEWYSIGIHPIFISKSDLQKDLETISTHLKNKKCLALGEIGLDKLTEVDFDLQIKVFQLQLEIAEAHHIPVIIHCVRSYQEILKIRKNMKLTIPFIFHGFNKNQQIVQQIINNNCIPSFGKNLLNNPNLQTIFANLSNTDFLLENDDSQIPIEEIYSEAADIKKCTMDELEILVSQNFNRIFKHYNA